MSRMSQTSAGQSEPDDSGNNELFARRETLRAAREAHMEALERIFAEINDEEIWCTFTAIELGVRRDQMQRHFAEMERSHTMYRQCCILASNQIYLDTELKFYQALAKIGEKLQELNQPELTCNQSTPSSAARRLTFGPYATPGPSNSTTSVEGQPIIRVETARRPQIGTFNGETADWPEFRDLFIAEVHNRNYDPVTKLHYLREACTGRAADTLGPWQPTAANYQLAWETMMAAYNDEYHIIHGILAKLHSTQKQEVENHAALRTILDSLNSGTRQLYSFTSSAILMDQIWIHHAKQRLPASALDAWEQYRNQNQPSTLPTLEFFKQFLDSKAKARREFEHESTLVPQEKSSAAKHDNKERRAQSGTGGTRFKPYDTSRRDNRKPSSESFGHAPPTLCVMSGCEQTHYLGQCQQFEKLSFADKMDVVREHQLCRCCLIKGHMALNCKRRGCAKCPDGKFKHHFRLCTKNLQPKQNPFTAPKTPAK